MGDPVNNSSIEASGNVSANTLRILIIEGDASLCGEMRSVLVARQHQVLAALDAADGLYLSARETSDVILIASALRQLDGLTIITTFRRHNSATSVLLLGDAGPEQRIQALEAGADDCLTKPFTMLEMQARVEVLGRRHLAHSRGLLRVGDVELDATARTVRRANRPIELQPKEFRLLEFMMRHAGQIVTRDMLLKGVWGYRFDPGTNIIETHVSRLRSRLNAGFGRELIHTIRGSGYCMRAIDKQ